MKLCPGLFQSFLRWEAIPKTVTDDGPHHWSHINRQKPFKTHSIQHLPGAKHCPKHWALRADKAGKIPALLELTFWKEDTDNNYDK